MGVQVLGERIGENGHEDSYAAFLDSHVANTNALLNLAEDKPKNAARPPYNPSHPDNQWPLMVHHAAKGELTIGQTLKGLIDPGERKRLQGLNEVAKKEALAMGYRLEPYVKPQVAVLDPAIEKAALQKRVQEQDGQVASLTDTLTKALARLDELEKK